MICVTNSQLNDIHTTLLFTDTPIDQSIYQQSFNNFGVISSSEKQRDGRNSLKFNGSSMIMLDKLNFTPGIGNWTIECWAYMTAFNSGAAIFHQNFGSRTGYGILIGYSSCQYIYITTANSTWNILSGASCWKPSANTWTHLAVVKNGATLTSYQNGIQVASYNVGNTASWRFDGKPTIGCYYYSTDTYITGYLQDFRISNIARYNSNFTPPVRLL